MASVFVAVVLIVAFAPANNPFNHVGLAKARSKKPLAAAATTAPRAIPTIAPVGSPSSSLGADGGDAGGGDAGGGDAGSGDAGGSHCWPPCPLLCLGISNAGSAESSRDSL